MYLVCEKFDPLLLNNGAAVKGLLLSDKTVLKNLLVNDKTVLKSLLLNKDMSTASKTITVSTLVIATLSFVLAIGPIVTSQAAFAANLCGSGFCERHTGTSYPSPLSNFFNHHHGHWHHGHWHHGHGNWHDHSHHSH
jgi:hypothetical protein